MMNPVSTVAITGATGYVGRFVVAELQRHGVQIRALARPQSSREGFDGPIGWIEGDLRSVDRFPALVDGVDAVIHLAYEHVPGRYRGGEGDNLDTWLDANLNGSLKLLTAARDAGVKRFVFLSSRAVFSKTESGRVLDETHPVSPDTHYGAYKVAVEAFLQSFAHTGDMKTCSIRSTGVYGMTYPVERSKWWNLIQTVVNGEPVIAGDARGGTEVHGDDVARVIWSWLTQSDTRAAADVIHLSDLYVTHREVVRLARELVTQALANCPGELPALPVKPPENQLVSSRLADLGVILGGIPLLEATIASLVRTAEDQTRK